MNAEFWLETLQETIRNNEINVKQGVTRRTHKAFLPIGQTNLVLSYLGNIKFYNPATICKLAHGSGCYIRKHRITETSPLSTPDSIIARNCKYVDYYCVSVSTTYSFTVQISSTLNLSDITSKFRYVAIRGCIQKFPEWVILTYTLTTINTRWETA
jgi:hypothetical protein